MNVGDKGKVSDVKDFSDKFGRDKRIGEVSQDWKLKDEFVPPRHSTEAVPISPCIKETNYCEKAEGLAAPTLASFFPSLAATSPKPALPPPPTTEPLPPTGSPWPHYEMWSSQVYRKEQWSPSDYVAPIDMLSLYCGQKESQADNEPEEDWDVFESEDENSSLDEFSSAHGECFGQETGQGLTGIGENLQKDLVMGAMASKAALQNLAQAKGVDKTSPEVEVIQLRQQLLAETIARKDAMKTISHLKGAMDMEEGEKAKEAAEWARRNNGLVEKLHTMEVKHAAEVNLMKRQLRHSQSFEIEKMGTISQLEEQLSAARKAWAEGLRRAEGREELWKLQRAELQLSDEEKSRKEGEEEKEVKLLVEVFNKEMLKVGKSFAESRRKMIKKVAALEERLRLVSKGVENVKFKGSITSEENSWGDQEKKGNVKVGQMITNVEEEFMKARELGASIASRQKLLEEDFEAGRRRQMELTKETEDAMEIVNRLKGVLKTLEDRQG